MDHADRSHCEGGQLTWPCLSGSHAHDRCPYSKIRSVTDYYVATEMVRIVNNFLTTRHRVKKKADLILKVFCAVMSSKMVFAIEFGVAE